MEQRMELEGTFVCSGDNGSEFHNVDPGPLEL